MTRHFPSTFTWLRQSASVALLRGMLEDEGKMTHEHLNQLGQRKGVTFVRDLLMSAGLLAPAEPHFTRLEVWLELLLQTCHLEDARLIRQYAQWSVFRRLRSRNRGRALTLGGNAFARLRFRVAAQFLQWLRSQNVLLSDLRQERLELWVTSGPASVRYRVRDIVNWLKSRKLVGDIAVPHIASKRAEPAFEQDQRWDLTERLLHDDTIAFDERVAALFVTVFAQHVSRIAELTDRHVQVEPPVAVRFGKEWIDMPPLFAELVVALVRRARADSKAHAAGAVFLFPGQHYGRPIVGESLLRRLRKRGLDVRQTRQAALFQLAANMPPEILSDLLGLHINTAVSWVRSRGSNWHMYAAQRSRRPKGTLEMQDS